MANKFYYMFYKGMKISPINLIQNNYSLSHSPKTIQNLRYDSVSFTSSKIEEQRRTKEAVDLGREIYAKFSNNGKCNISKIVNSRVKNIKIVPMSEFHKENPSAELYTAFFSYDFYDDFRPKEARMYIGDFPQENSPTARLLYAIDVAHEFTHAKQMDDDLKSIKTMSQGNIDYARAIIGVGDAIFQYYETQTEAQMVSKSLDSNDFAQMFVYKKPVPRKGFITKEKLLALNNFRDEQDFQKQMNNIFEMVFDAFFELSSKESPNVDPRVRKGVLKVVSDGQEEKFKNDIRAYVADCAQREKEAYTTESELAKKILKVDNVNTEAFKIYYTMLRDALK